MPNVTHKNVREQGATLEIAIGPSVPRLKALEQAGLPPVYPIVVRGLLDPGAKTTFIDFSLVKGLGLRPTGEVDITTPSTGKQRLKAPTFDVQLTFIGPPNATPWPALSVAPVDLDAFGVRVLLGRDVLSRGLLFYNGPSDQFTFSF